MKITLLALFAVLVCQQTSACDFCNCISGINPYYNGADKLMIHFLYQRSISPPITSGSSAEEVSALLKSDAILSPTGINHHIEAGGGTESRRTLELGYQYHLFDDLMFTALLPYTMMNEQSSSSYSLRGFGDLSVLAHYIITFEREESWRTTWLLGGGIKLPTGDNSGHYTNGVRLDPRLQHGTGSTDFIFNTTLMAQHKSWTFALDVFGKLNSTNSFNDKLGNSLALALNASRDIYRNNQSLVAIVGTLGVRTEIAARDKVAGAIDGDSGFTNTYVNAGAQFVFDWFKFDAGFLIPVIQNRGSGFPEEQTRFLGGIRWEF